MSSGMIGARNPHGVVADHAAPACQDVLQRVVEGMTHVQRGGDVWRRNDDDVRVFLGVWGGVTSAGLGP